MIERGVEFASLNNGFAVTRVERREGYSKNSGRMDISRDRNEFYGILNIFP